MSVSQQRMLICPECKPVRATKVIQKGVWFIA